MSTSRRKSVKISGKVLYLTEDAELLKQQLGGEAIAFDPERHALVNNISTDELTPGWVCYYYDETLARYCLVGLRGGVIQRDAVKNGGFEVIVSGRSKGCGSSRETAPYSEREAGDADRRRQEHREDLRAELPEHRPAHDHRLRHHRARRCAARRSRSASSPAGSIRSAPTSSSTAGSSPTTRRASRARCTPPTITTPARPMTLCEKILARHAIVDAQKGTLGVPAVKPGDALFVRTDVRFSHEYVTPMAESLFRAGLGPDAKVSEPESVFAFRDHLTFLDQVIPEAHVKLGLREQSQSLATVQEAFTKKQGIKLYGEVFRDGKLVGSEAICHNKVIEELALPGQVVAGTDSHTCMGGALGCFAFGVGSTDMANAWLTRDVRVAVPESARFNLHGELPAGVTAKDVMLYLLSQPFWKSGDGIGKVLEFAGSGVRAMGLDERATLTNMAVEAGGFTGIIEADEVVVEYLVKQRGLDADAVRAADRQGRRGRDLRGHVRRRSRRRSSRWWRRRATRATACRCARSTKLAAAT